MLSLPGEVVHEDIFFNLDLKDAVSYILASKTRVTQQLLDYLSRIHHLPYVRSLHSLISASKRHRDDLIVMCIMTDDLPSLENVVSELEYANDKITNAFDDDNAIISDTFNYIISITEDRYNLALIALRRGMEEEFRLCYNKESYHDYFDYAINPEPIRILVNVAGIQSNSEDYINLMNNLAIGRFNEEYLSMLDKMIEDGNLADVIRNRIQLLATLDTPLDGLKKIVDSSEDDIVDVIKYVVNLVSRLPMIRTNKARLIRYLEIVQYIRVNYPHYPLFD